MKWCVSVSVCVCVCVCVCLCVVLELCFRGFPVRRRRFASTEHGTTYVRTHTVHLCFAWLRFLLRCRVYSFRFFVVCPLYSHRPSRAPRIVALSATSQPRQPPPPDVHRVNMLPLPRLCV